MADSEASEAETSDPDPFSSFGLRTYPLPANYPPYTSHTTQRPNLHKALHNPELQKIALEEYLITHHFTPSTRTFHGLQQKNPAIARHYLERAYDLHVAAQPTPYCCGLLKKKSQFRIRTREDDRRHVLDEGLVARMRALWEKDWDGKRIWEREFELKDQWRSARMEEEREMVAARKRNRSLQVHEEKQCKSRTESKELAGEKESMLNV